MSADRYTAYSDQEMKLQLKNLTATEKNEKHRENKASLFHNSPSNVFNEPLNHRNHTTIMSNSYQPLGNNITIHNDTIPNNDLDGKMDETVKALHFFSSQSVPKNSNQEKCVSTTPSLSIPQTLPENLTNLKFLSHHFSPSNHVPNNNPIIVEDKSQHFSSSNTVHYYHQQDLTTNQFNSIQFLPPFLLNKNNNYNFFPNLFQDPSSAGKINRPHLTTLRLNNLGSSPRDIMSLLDVTNGDNNLMNLSTHWSKQPTKRPGAYHSPGNLQNQQNQQNRQNHQNQQNHQNHQNHRNNISNNTHPKSISTTPSPPETPSPSGSDSLNGLFGLSSVHNTNNRVNFTNNNNNTNHNHGANNRLNNHRGSNNNHLNNLTNTLNITTHTTNNNHLNDLDITPKQSKTHPHSVTPSPLPSNTDDIAVTDAVIEALTTNVSPVASTASLQSTVVFSSPTTPSSSGNSSSRSLLLAHLNRIDDGNDRSKGRDQGIDGIDGIDDDRNHRGGYNGQNGQNGHYNGCNDHNNHCDIDSHDHHDRHDRNNHRGIDINNQRNNHCNIDANHHHNNKNNNNNHNNNNNNNNNNHNNDIVNINNHKNNNDIANINHNNNNVIIVNTNDHASRNERIEALISNAHANNNPNNPSKPPPTPKQPVPKPLKTVIYPIYLAAPLDIHNTNNFNQGVISQLWFASHPRFRPQPLYMKFDAIYSPVTHLPVHPQDITRNSRILMNSAYNEPFSSSSQALPPIILHQYRATYLTSTFTPNIDFVLYRKTPTKTKGLVNGVGNGTHGGAVLMNYGGAHGGQSSGVNLALLNSLVNNSLTNTGSNITAASLASLSHHQINRLTMGSGITNQGEEQELLQQGLFQNMFANDNGTMIQNGQNGQNGQNNAQTAVNGVIQNGLQNIQKGEEGLNTSQICQNYGMDDPNGSHCFQNGQKGQNCPNYPNCLQNGQNGQNGLKTCGCGLNFLPPSLVYSPHVILGGITPVVDRVNNVIDITTLPNPRSRQTLDAFGYSGSSYDELVQCGRLFIGQIPPTQDPLQLYFILSCFGVIEELVFLKDRTTLTHTGAAFCTFCDPVAARRAVVDLDGAIRLHGANEPLMVRISPRRQKGSERYHANSQGGSNSNSTANTAVNNVPLVVIDGNNKVEIMENVALTKIFMNNIPPNITPDVILSLFRRYDPYAHPLILLEEDGVGLYYAVVVVQKQFAKRIITAYSHFAFNLADGVQSLVCELYDCALMVQFVDNNNNKKNAVLYQQQQQKSAQYNARVILGFCNPSDNQNNQNNTQNVNNTNGQSNNNNNNNQNNTIAINTNKNLSNTGLVPLQQAQSGFVIIPPPQIKVQTQQQLIKKPSFQSQGFPDLTIEQQVIQQQQNELALQQSIVFSSQQQQLNQQQQHMLIQQHQQQQHALQNILQGNTGRKNSLPLIHIPQNDHFQRNNGHNIHNNNNNNNNNNHLQNLLFQPSPTHNIHFSSPQLPYTTNNSTSLRASQYPQSQSFNNYFGPQDDLMSGDFGDNDNNNNNTKNDLINRPNHLQNAHNGQNNGQNIDATRPVRPTTQPMSTARINLIPITQHPIITISNDSNNSSIVSGSNNHSNSNYHSNSNHQGSHNGSNSNHDHLMNINTGNNNINNTFHHQQQRHQDSLQQQQQQQQQRSFLQNSLQPLQNNVQNNIQNTLQGSSLLQSTSYQLFYQPQQQSAQQMVTQQLQGMNNGVISPHHGAQGLSTQNNLNITPNTLNNVQNAQNNGQNNTNNLNNQQANLPFPLASTNITTNTPHQPYSTHLLNNNENSLTSTGINNITNNNKNSHNSTNNNTALTMDPNNINPPYILPLGTPSSSNSYLSMGYRAPSGPNSFGDARDGVSSSATMATTGLIKINNNNNNHIGNINNSHNFGKNSDTDNNNIVGDNGLGINNNAFIMRTNTLTNPLLNQPPRQQVQDTMAMAMAMMKDCGKNERRSSQQFNMNPLHLQHYSQSPPISPSNSAQYSTYHPSMYSSQYDEMSGSINNDGFVFVDHIQQQSQQQQLLQNSSFQQPYQNHQNVQYPTNSFNNINQNGNIVLNNNTNNNNNNNHHTQISNTNLQPYHGDVTIPLFDLISSVETINLSNEHDNNQQHLNIVKNNHTKNNNNHNNNHNTNNNHNNNNMNVTNHNPQQHYSNQQQHKHVLATRHSVSGRSVNSTSSTISNNNNNNTNGRRGNHHNNPNLHHNHHNHHNHQNNNTKNHHSTHHSYSKPHQSHSNKNKGGQASQLASITSFQPFVPNGLVLDSNHNNNTNNNKNNKAPY